MSDHDRFSLFTEARERLGRSLLGALASAIPEIAQGLDRNAERATSIAARRELFAVSATLRIESDTRAQRARATLYDVAFTLLEVNQSADPTGAMPWALLADDALDHRILAEDLARAVRGRLGEAHPVWLARVDALTRSVTDDACAPLGAQALATAALEGLRPMSAEPASRGAVREGVLAHLVVPLSDAIADADQWLAAQGIAPWTPQPATRDEPVRPDATAAVAGLVLPAGVDPPPTPVTILQAMAPTLPTIAPTSPPDPRDTARPPPVAPLPERVAAALDAGAVQVPPAAPGPPDAGIDAVDPQPATVEVLQTASAEASSDLLDVVPTAEAPMEQAAEALVHSTQVADVLGRQPFAAGRPEAGYRFAGTLPRPQAYERDAVAFAHHVGVAPYTRDARQRYFGGLRDRMLAAQAPAAQLAALDLVAALFDYVVDDTRMPAAAQPLLWRLQHPAVTLAALDAGFLGDDRRSVRRLVENLSAISVAYADDVTPGSELHRRLETVVRAVEVVAHAFQSRSSVLGEQVRREYDRAAHGVTQLVARVVRERTALESTPGRRNRRDYARRPTREREIEVTRALEADLRARLERARVSESVRDFVLGVWLRHLRTALLRDGEHSESFRLAIATVDDLLWSLDTAGPRQSRRELAGRIPPLIRLLTQGVSDIGARPEEFRPFLDELFLIHLRKMQRVPRGAERGDLTEPAHPVEVGTQAAEGARDTPDSPNAERSMPTDVPDATDATDATDAIDVPTGPSMSDRGVDGADDATSTVRRPDPLRPVDLPVPPFLIAPADPLPLRPEAPAGTKPVAAHPNDLDAPRDASEDVDASPAAASEADDRHAPDGDMPAVPPPSGADDARRPPIDTAHVSREVIRPRLPRPIIDARGPSSEASGDQRLLSVLSSVDLGDFPDAPQRLRLDADDALARLERGDWLELVGRDGLPQDVKVAWINARRTVVLLVRRPDRRALSLRSAELHQRFQQHKAALIVRGDSA